MREAMDSGVLVPLTRHSSLVTNAVRLAALWFRAMRVPFFTASVMPVLVGTAAGFYTSGVFRLGYFALAMVGMVAVHASANMLNDYFGHRSGGDLGNPGQSKMNGGSGVIAEGLVSPDAMLRASIFCYAIGAACGLWLIGSMGQRGWPVLAMGVLGIAASITYTSPWVYLAGKGLGELCLGLTLGILPVLGAAYVQTGSFSTAAFLVGVPPAGLIMALLWINQYPDVPADRAVGKLNLVVRLGRSRARIGYYGLLVVVFGSLFVAVATGGLPGWALLGAALLPVAARSAWLLEHRYADERPGAVLPVQVAMFATHMLTGTLMAAGLVIARLVQ